MGKEVSHNLIDLNKDQNDATQRFSTEVNKSLINTSLILLENEKGEGEDEKQVFKSFTLKGPKAPRKKKTMNESQRIQLEEQKRKLVGRMKEVKGRLITLRDKRKSKKNEEKLVLQLTIKYFGATDVAKNLELDGNVQQKITQLIVGGDESSLALSEWGQVSTETELNFLSAELELEDGVWKLDLSKKAKCQFSRHKTKNNSNEGSKRNKLLSHDIPKNFLLSPSALFFQRLGLTDHSGKPKKAKSSKLRQCQKFVEVVSGLVTESFDSPKSGNNKDIDSAKSSIVTHDMGCGRGYLTFALHSHLYQRFSSSFDIKSIGVDMRPKLVQEINSIASDLGSEFDGLRFVTGTIDNVDIDSKIDILIALHACDTATDDSIWYGIENEASIIVVAPCCHKEVRRYLNQFVSEVNDHPYADILRHNIYKERIAETVTDSIRALLLELTDYNVQVFEFIGGEHTNKNVMITATKRATPRSSAQKDQLRKRLRSLAKLHGVHGQKLAQLMNESLEGDTVNKKQRMVNTSTGMPTL